MKSEYPKEMRHPGFAPAVLSVPPPIVPGQIRPDSRPGTPARFPPVVVNNSDQEEYHASRGYLAGKHLMPLVTQYTHKERENIRMREVPQADEPPPTGEFPKWVGDKIAKNAEEEAKILADAAAVLGTVEPTPLTSEQISASGSATFMPYRDKIVARAERDAEVLSIHDALQILGMDSAELAEFRAWKANRERSERMQSSPPEKRKRRPMSEEQRQRARENLAKARAARGRYDRESGHAEGI